MNKYNWPNHWSIILSFLKMAAICCNKKECERENGKCEAREREREKEDKNGDWKELPSGSSRKWKIKAVQGLEILGN